MAGIVSDAVPGLGCTRTQAARGVIQLEVQGNQAIIRGGTHVGLVVLPSGRHLIVRSKVPSVTLLEWLEFVGDFPRLTTWLPQAGVSQGDDWHKCIGRLFLFAMELVTRQHLRRDFVPVALHASAIRGRIVTKALRKNGIYCRDCRKCSGVELLTRSLTAYWQRLSIDSQSC